jgi:hypothetical protein
VKQSLRGRPRKAKRLAEAEEAVVKALIEIQNDVGRAIAHAREATAIEEREKAGHVAMVLGAERRLIDALRRGRV